LRIGYVYPFKAFPPRGGNGVHAHQLIKGFTAAGHSVLTPADDTPPEVECFGIDEPGIRQFLEAIDILYVRVDGNRLSQTPWVVELIERTSTPVVWEINAPANETLAFSWLGGSRSARGVTGPAGRLWDRMRREVHAGRKRPNIWLEERLRKRLAGKVDAAVCVSSPVARYASEELGIRDVRVVPNGSDIALNHPDRERIALSDSMQKRFKVLYAGSPTYPWQGLGLLRDTIALSRARGLDFGFILLMNQPLTEAIEGDDVVVAEQVPYKEVGCYICSADACVSLQPEFHWSKWGFHGSPMKLFDYMACGKPVVCANVGQMREVIQEYEAGLTCEHDPEDLLRALVELSDNADVRTEMGVRGRAATESHFNWEVISERTVEALDASLERGTRSPE